MPSSTSSFRIPDELKSRLEEASRRTNMGKNRIINRALDEYLDRHSRTGLRQEARRQSLLASRKAANGDAGWERAAAEVWNG
jgi:predicted transcriptional regulator